MIRALILAALAACVDPRAECAKKGGSYDVTGYTTYCHPVGRSTVCNTQPTYECRYRLDRRPERAP